MFTIPVIPLFRPKGSLARTFSREFLLPEPLAGHDKGAEIAVKALGDVLSLVDGATRHH
jgi:hypothetical protein